MMAIGRDKKTLNTQSMHLLIRIIVLTVIVVVGIWGMKVYGVTKRIVRVGFFPMDGYHEKSEDGSYTGMDVEYLEALCDYVNWEIEYVECSSWDNALEMLLNEEIDLVGSAQYSQERAQYYQYADLASGYTFGTIAVNGDSPLAYEDFDAMSDITFGVVRSYIRKGEFYEYLEGHGIAHPRVIEYENTAELQSALASGEIDALVHSLTEVREGQRVVGRFAPMPFYYISYQQNDDVMRELNQGISDLKMNRPELENELMVKYYDSRLDQTILLTSEEKQYIKEKQDLQVGYLEGYYPFSYEAQGEYCGLARQVLEEVAVSTGLHIEYVRMKNLQEAKEALNSGKIDILNYCGETPKNMRLEGIAVTKVYAQVPHVVIMRKNDKTETINKLAVTQEGVADSKSLDFAGENVQMCIYNTQLDCLYAVKSGEADAALCDGYLAEYLLSSEFGLGSLEIHSVLSKAHLIYMAVEEEEWLLLRILNKELLGISDKMVNDYMLRDNFYSKMSIETFIRDHSILIILLLVAVAAIIIFVMYRMLQNSRHIQRLMYKDTNFNIWNLNYLKYQASRKLATDKNARYAVVYTDICQFRRYNTLYGWHAGQRILELFIEVVSEEFDNKNELYARSYGDHFVFFMKYDTIETLRKRLTKIGDAISSRIYDEVQIHMTLAMGVSCIPQGEEDIQVALSYGIQVIDTLKNSYSNVVRFYDETLRDQLKEHHEREKVLELAQIDKDFVTYYQAKVDIRSEQIVGAEALVRFKDPTDNGAIRSPGFFVPYYEQTGKIAQIDFFVMESVCKMLRRRIDSGKKVVPISCNFSRIHFVKEGFLEQFEALIEKYQVPKELLEVEITETIVVEDLQRQKVKETVDVLRQNGVRLSIDDFGSGYSSLGVFEQIPASVIKLDRSFLLNNENRMRQVKVMKNIINLAQDLDAQVVCEGVETQKDTELMMEIGAYVAQGYHYSKPVPEEVFERKLDDMEAFA